MRDRCEHSHVPLTVVSCPNAHDATMVEGTSGSSCSATRQATPTSRRSSARTRSPLPLGRDGDLDLAMPRIVNPLVGHPNRRVRQRLAWQRPLSAPTSVPSARTARSHRIVTPRARTFTRSGRLSRWKGSHLWPVSARSSSSRDGDDVRLWDRSSKATRLNSAALRAVEPPKGGGVNGQEGQAGEVK
jgi:hypothetical protein